MERLNERLQQAARALSTLQMLADIAHPSDIERDAAIQRFEYSFEAIWKAVKRYLDVVEGVQAASPKSVVRACLENGLLDEQQARAALVMVDDRNLTSHTYNEDLAAAIFSRIPDHSATLEQWLSAVISRMNVER
jgi:nucleotidyltransferase substrate binding protein (TIGR01987 family)